MTLICGLVACKGNPTVSDKDVELIDYPDVVKLLADRKSRVVLVDVRAPEKFAVEHIPGAVNIKLPDMGPNDKRLAEAKTIVVYDDGTGFSLSNAGAKRLLWHEYKNVYDFRGGLNLWKKSGGATEGATTGE
jgi:rhodanese-related sulfurtransferase